MELRILEIAGEEFESRLRSQVVIYLDDDGHPMHVHDMGFAIPGNEYRHEIQPVHERIDKLLVACRVEFRDETEDCLGSVEFRPAGKNYVLLWHVPTKEEFVYPKDQ
jgi:hypothetical protein